MGSYSPSTALAIAISNAEGYGASSSNIPTTANNPGDLALGDIGYGTLGNNITVYPDEETGFSALLNQTDSILSGSSANYDGSMSLNDIGAIYSGNDLNWANNVASNLGISPDAPVSTISGSGAASTTPSTSPSLLSQAASSLNPFSGITNGVSSVTSFLTSSRLIYIIVGLILVAAGLFSFKTTQTVIEHTGKLASKGAELLA